MHTHSCSAVRVLGKRYPTFGNYKKHFGNWILEPLALHIFRTPTMKNCNKNGQKYGGPRLQEGLQMLQFCIETSLAKLLHFLSHFEYGGPYTRAATGWGVQNASR